MELEDFTAKQRKEYEMGGLKAGDKVMVGNHITNCNEAWYFVEQNDKIVTMERGKGKGREVLEFKHVEYGHYQNLKIEKVSMNRELIIKKNEEEDSTMNEKLPPIPKTTGIGVSPPKSHHNTYNSSPVLLEVCDDDLNEKVCMDDEIKKLKRMLRASGELSDTVRLLVGGVEPIMGARIKPVDVYALRDVLEDIRTKLDRYDALILDGLCKHI
jgi:hypothetical protein